MTRDHERNARAATHPPCDDVPKMPAPVQDDDVGSGDSVFQVPREPERALERVLSRYGIRSDRRRSGRLGRIEERGDLDAMTRQGLAPTSRCVRRAGLASAEVLLIVNDPDRSLRLVGRWQLQAVNDYGMPIRSSVVVSAIRPTDRPIDRLDTLRA